MGNPATNPKRRTARYILFGLLVSIALACVGSTGERILKSCGRLFSDKYMTVAQFGERFNASLQPSGYSIDFSGASWLRVGEGTYTLTAPLYNPLQNNANCIITVAAREQPTLSYTLQSVCFEERVPLSVYQEDSSLIVPAHTVFQLFTPDYVQNPDWRNASGYTFHALWAAFLDAMQKTQCSEGIPYFPAAVKGNGSRRADVFHIEVQPVEGGVMRTLDWYWT